MGSWYNKYYIQKIKFRNNWIAEHLNNEKIIRTHVKRGNIIVSDAWAAYSWLDDANSGYIHHVHNHGHGDFGFGIDTLVI